MSESGLGRVKTPLPGKSERSSVELRKRRFKPLKRREPASHIVKPAAAGSGYPNSRVTAILVVVSTIFAFFIQDLKC